jgi:hypothetical protein
MTDEEHDFFYQLLQKFRFFSLSRCIYFFHHFQYAFIKKIDISTLYFFKIKFKVFNNYLMSNLTHIMVFRFRSKIICVFPKKGEMQNISYQLLSNAFCGLRLEWSQKTHMTSN